MAIRNIRWLSIGIAALLMTLLLDSVALGAEETDTSDQGALIISVIADSPAHEAGLVRGDIILSMDEETVDSSAELAKLIREASPGEVVTLTVLHGDDQYIVDVELGDRGGRANLGVYLARDIRAHPTPGFWPRPAPDMWGMKPFTDTAGGALVTEVIAESPAEAAGIEMGDVILGVEGERLTKASDLADRIADYGPGEEVTLEVLRRTGALEDVTVTLGARPDDAEKAYLGIRYLPTPRRMFLGHSAEGNLLVPPPPYYRRGPRFDGPRYQGPPDWRPGMPPRNHRWLPYAYPMPHHGCDEAPCWGWDDD